MSQKRKHAQINSFFQSQSQSQFSPLNSAQDATEAEIFTSRIIEDRGSKFTALFSVSARYISSPRDLALHPSLDGADHKILAWRLRNENPQKRTQQSPAVIGRSAGSHRTYSDDDGEKWAGRKVEDVLVSCGVQEGVCVVGRWWGGVMLGRARFEHIESVAREAVGKSLTQNQKGIGAEIVKNERAADNDNPKEEDPEQKARLIRILQERDQSILVLRGLLSEKQAILAGSKKETESDGCSPATASPIVRPMPDYQLMTVLKLRGLEKARDATLGWILKQIEGVERRIGNAGGGDDGGGGESV